MADNEEDIIKDTHLTLEETIKAGQDPADFYWPFNGLTPEGKRFSMDVPTFVAWASALHPEYVDETTGAPLVYDFVMTADDEDLAGIPGLAGTVMVTILPMLDGNVSYATVAKEAASRYPANPKVRERFLKLHALFEERESGVDKE